MRATLWIVVGLLVLIGVAAAVARAVFTGDLAHRVATIRPVLNLPPYSEEDLSEVDNKFGSHRAITLMHVVPGGLFLLLAPLQFVPAIRNRYLRAHRRLGRVLIVAALISGAAGIFFGIYQPLGGMREAVGILLFGAFLFLAVTRGYLAIRNGRVALHREWMIRAFATALAISTVRVAASVIDFAQMFANNHRSQFVLSIWSGWLMTLAIAEIWIRYSRGRYSLDSFSSTSQQLPLRTPVPELPSTGKDASFS